MGLNAPPQGLRAIFHNSNQTERVTLTVGAGDHLAVSDDVAAQLFAASTHFQEAGYVPSPKVTAAAVEEVEAEEAPAAEEEDAPAPVRRSRKGKS